MKSGHYNTMEDSEVGALPGLSKEVLRRDLC